MSLSEMKVERNIFSVPLKQIDDDDDGTPPQHFNIRYRKVADGPLFLAPFVSLLSSLSPPLCILHLCFLRMKRELCGKKCSCRPKLTLSPFKTCPLDQAMMWRSQRSTQMALRSPLPLTSPSENSQVCGPARSPHRKEKCSLPQ